MAALNFPTNRSELDPPQPAGPLQDGDAFAEAGITWTWNATLSVWSTDGNGGFTQDVADTRYLRLDASNDPVTGTCEFSAGVNVTGGTGVHSVEVSAQANRPGAAYYAYNRLGQFPATNSCTQAIGYQSTIIARTDNDLGYTGEYAHFRADVPASVTSAQSPQFSSFYGYHAGGSNQDDIRCSGLKAAFFCGWNTNANASDTYSFYASGSAPNFFQGYVITKNAIIVSALDDWALNPPQDQSVGFSIRTSGNLLSYLGNDTGAYHRTGRENNGDLHRFHLGNTHIGSIRVASSALDYWKASDYRLKDNITDLGSAVDQVKNLRPVSYEMKTSPGYTHVGFLAHEVQQVVPQAVVGEKDAIETIGTLTTAEGEVETNVPEPETLPYGSTWEATGTRDDIQLMSQSNLIPILTKALQEALEQIEQLEATKSDLLGRIEALERENTIDDASDTAVLVLVTELTQKVQALESAVGI